MTTRLGKFPIRKHHSWTDKLAVRAIDTAERQRVFADRGMIVIRKSRSVNTLTCTVHPDSQQSTHSSGWLTAKLGAYGKLREA